jgi:HSP20 family protein
MSLFSQFDSLFDTADRLLNGQSAVPGFVPAADLVVSEEGVTVLMDTPGLTPENLEIELIGDVLTVRGERAYPYPTDQTQRNWYRLERGYGKFQRILQVPKGLDPENIHASMANGVLTLWLPRPETQKPRRIAIVPGERQGAFDSTAGEQHTIEGHASSLEESSAPDRELAGASA